MANNHLQHTIASEKTRDLVKPVRELLAQQHALLEAWGQLTDEQAWEYSEQQLNRIETLLQTINGQEN